MKRHQSIQPVFGVTPAGFRYLMGFRQQLANHSSGERLRKISKAS